MKKNSDFSANNCQETMPSLENACEYRSKQAGKLFKRTLGGGGEELFCGTRQRFKDPLKMTPNPRPS